MKLLQDLRWHFVQQNVGNEECSKYFLGRGSAATSGVEGFYTSDGNQTAHSLLWRAEGPNDVTEMANHFLVSRLVGYPQSLYLTISIHLA